MVVLASKFTSIYLKSSPGSLDEDQSDHSQQSLLSGSDQFDDNIEEEFTISDPRLELRIFALKQIQKYFIQKYRQLRVISFDESCSYGKSVAKMLTPSKGPFILPDHLPEFLGDTKVYQGCSLIEQKLCNALKKENEI